MEGGGGRVFEQWRRLEGREERRRRALTAAVSSDDVMNGKEERVTSRRFDSLSAVQDSAAAR